jgi:hypothetical protein
MLLFFGKLAADIFLCYPSIDLCVDAGEMSLAVARPARRTITETGFVSCSRRTRSNVNVDSWRQTTLFLHIHSITSSTARYSTRLVYHFDASQYVASAHCPSRSNSPLVHVHVPGQNNGQSTLNDEQQSVSVVSPCVTNHRDDHHSVAVVSPSTPSTRRREERAASSRWHRTRSLERRAKESIDSSSNNTRSYSSSSIALLCERHDKTQHDTRERVQTSDNVSDHHDVDCAFACCPFPRVCVCVCLT